MTGDIMILIIDRDKCQQCWTCTSKSELNGLPDMAYKGIDLARWPEDDADLLGMIIAARNDCPHQAMAIITKTEFNRRKNG